MHGVQLLQLPLHPGTAWEPTGNIPLAPARLAAAAGLPRESVFPQELLDSLGDRALLDELHRRDPEVIGVTLYLWNRERTLHLLREYRKLNPYVTVVAGGPEVTGDNVSLLGEDCIDLFVAGEGEPRATEVLDICSLSALKTSGKRFLPAAPDSSPPDSWPDPYETGHISPAAGGSAHLETQRGCACLCSYCAYRRTHPVPRITPWDTVLKKIGNLLDAGAMELVFLDPTFNSRNDLHRLLEGMAGLGADCFAEVRGDLLGPGDARLMKEAGFASLEVGLQTMNGDVLKAVGRAGSPGRILQGAETLQEHGVTPVVDLILGLPGDHPRYVELAAEELVNRGISSQVQTFCLSVLPGTALRSDAASLGIRYMDRPPYCVTRSGGLSLKALMKARERVSDILGYDADPPPRPVLCDGFPGTEIFRPGETPDAGAFSVRHGVLRIVSRDPWASRDQVMNRILRRRETDPFCPLDVVIETGREFPLDLLDRIAAIPGKPCYDMEKAVIYDVPPLLRIAVITDGTADPGWLAECSKIATTVVRADSERALPGGRTGLLLEGNHDLSGLSALYGSAPELVFFREYRLERLWNLDVLGLG